MDLKAASHFRHRPRGGHRIESGLAAEPHPTGSLGKSSNFSSNWACSSLTHVGRRLVLTSEGEQLLGESRNLLAHAGALGQRAEFLRRGNEGPLRVAASPVQIEAVLATFLRRYTSRYPRVQMR